MKEQFDKKLVQKIRDSFESHEEPFDPKEWDKFSQQYFGQSRKSIPVWLYWASAVAACIAVGLVLLNPLQDETRDIERQVSEATMPSAGENPVVENLGESKESGLIDNKNPETNPNTTKGSKNVAEKNGNLALADVRISTEEKTRSVGSSKTLSVFAEKTELKQDDLTTKEIAALPERNPDLQNTLLPTSPTEAEEAERLIQNWLAEAGADEGEEEKQASEERNPLKLGVLLAPQNISNSNQNINFGAGLMSEISFSKRLKLDVGVGYAKQNLTPESASRGGQFMADIGSADGQKAYMMSSNYIRSSSELSFGQIEIPLNMKYSFVQKKTADFYLVSGVSNMFYINQEKTVTFNTVSFAAQGMNASPQMVGSATVTEAPSGSQNQVDVGQLINFGLGFEHHLKNGTSLSFEPFYKFSVGDQTFVNQRFAIGGINLRMNFQLK